MSEKNVQDYLEHGMYGTPQIKPEEKKQFLGNYRERVFLTVKKTDVKRMLSDNLLTKEIKQLPNGQVFIHSLISSDALNKCIQICKSQNYPFTMVTRDSQPTNDTICLVIADNVALNIDQVDLSEKYPIEEATNNQKEKNFFNKLFGKA